MSSKKAINRAKPFTSGSTLFLKAVIILLGIAVFALCVLVLPMGIMSDETGMYRPILIGMYIPAIPFFIGLYQATKLLSFIEKNEIFSEASVKTLHTITYCAGAISVVYALGLPYIFTVADRDDAPGVLLIAFIFTFAPLVVCAAAAVFKRLLQNVVDIKSENELTV